MSRVAGDVTGRIDLQRRRHPDDLEIRVESVLDTVTPTAHAPAPHGLRRLVGRRDVPVALLLGDVVALWLAGDGTREWFLLVGLFPLLAASGGFYRSRLALLVLDDISGLVIRLLAAAGIVAVAIEGFGRGPLDGWWWHIAVAAFLVGTARALVYATVRYARSRHWVDHTTLIVGSGEVGQRLARSLLEHPEYGLRPIGFFDPDPMIDAGLPVIAPDVSLEQTLRETGATVVVLAFSTIPEVDLVKTVRACTRLNAEIFYVPRLFDLHSLSVHDIDDVWGTPLVRLRRASHRTLTWRAKRVFDVVVAALGLLVTGPLLIVVAALIRVRMGRPVLFRQERMSIDHRPFDIIKFRTLPMTDPNASDTDWNAATRRPGRLGAFLRATSIDELPQLWNVLTGDMSLVGPRPEREHFVNEFAARFDHYVDRNRVPAGLTGLAQIHGLRGDTSIDERARFDNAYVERWSFGNDVKIMLRTLVAAVRWRGR